MSTHIAIYVRVSSKTQDQRSQIRDLEKWATTQDSEIVWYRDRFTGRTMDRPAWNKLVWAIESGKVAQVVCWRFDRLGRTAKGLTALFDDLTKRKVGLFSLRDCLDITTPAGRLMANVLASVASYENEVRAERVLAGQAAAREQGSLGVVQNLDAKFLLLTNKRPKFSQCVVKKLRQLHAPLG